MNHLARARKITHVSSEKELWSHDQDRVARENCNTSVGALCVPIVSQATDLFNKKYLTVSENQFLKRTNDYKMVRLILIFVQ